MYYWLCPNDQRFDSWAFFRQGPDKLVKSGFCANISCRKCGKFDELIALQHVEELPLKVNSRDDFISSADGVIFVSDRFQELVAESVLDTLEFLRTPSLKGYSVMVPKRSLPFAPTISGMQFLRQCSECNRYRETCLSPMLESLTIDAFPWLIGHADVRFEHVNAQQFWFIAKSQLVSELKTSRVRGLQFLAVEKLTG